ncbi:hypothetical protein BDF22DRAFT_702590 [Syncephalis plumigaleata]|nr:hypothetical protein BDF22DRAFT_702590 [Syncephalis plumigaleata]
MAQHQQNQSSLEAWLLERLSCLMGISKDDIHELVPYVMSMETDNLLRDYLTGLLGDTTEVLSFIDELVRKKREPNSSKAGDSSSHVSGGKSKANREQSSTTMQKKAKDKQKANSSNASSDSSSSMNHLAQAFGGGGSVYRKSDKDDVYIPSGTGQSKTSNQAQHHKSKGSAPSSGRNTPTPKSQSIATKKDQASTSGKSKEKKEKEKSKKVATNRATCYCMAKVHKLFTNCLKCGKIICTAEGPGPCTFCGNLVESPQQQLALLAREQRQRKQNPASHRKVPAGSIRPDHTRSYKSKVVGGFSEGWHEPHESVEPAVAVEEEDADTRNARLLAEARKERLLEFDRTSARRTHVIDQASDFALPNDVDDRWLDPEERAQQAAIRQQRLEALEAQERRSGKARVITIDLAGRCIVEEKSKNSLLTPAASISSSSQRVPSPVNVMAKAIDTSTSANASKSLKNTLKNPLLTKKMRPVYVAEKTPPSVAPKADTKAKTLQSTIDNAIESNNTEWTSAPVSSASTSTRSALNIRTR